MHATAQALLDAHTRHFMTRLDGDSLATILDEETAFFWQWLGKRPVNSLTDSVRVRDLLARTVLDVAPSERLLQQIGQLAMVAIKSPLNANTKLEELLNAREYDQIVDNLIALEDLRRDIVHTVMQNQAVTDLISDLVYNGVKNYLAENSGLAKKVPGMSSLMKVGKGMMERVGADDALEGALKSYVTRNTRATMELSERLVERALEAPKLKTISRQFWQRVKGAPLSAITKHVREKDVNDTVAIGNTLWNHYRQTGYARDLLGQLTQAWFERWGNDPAITVLEGLGLSESRLQQEVREIGIPLVAELRRDGVLEARIRARLAEFYGSDEVAALLG